MPTKYNTLEGLRFISSVMIVLTHYVPYTLADQTALNWTSSFSYAVDLFFVISGIVIAHVYGKDWNLRRDYGSFLKNRIARIYPLHLATLLFYVVIGCLVVGGLLNAANADKYNFADLIPNLLLVHAWGFAQGFSFNYVSWSVSAEFFVYLLFPLVLWLMTRGNIASLAVLAAFFVSAWFAAPIIAGRPLPLLTWDYSILRALPAFSLGVWLQMRCPAKSFERFAPWLFHGLLISTAVALLTHQGPLLCLFLVYGVAATGFLCDRANVPTVASWAPLRERGELTYSIYMLHPLVATVLFSVLAPRILGGVTLPVVVAGLAATYVAAIISLRYFEMPMRQAIKHGLFRRHQPA